MHDQSRMAIVAIAAIAGMLALLGYLLLRPGGNSPDTAPLFHVSCEGGMVLDGPEDRAQGEKVTAYLPIIATDTDYTFYVRGANSEEVDFSESQGYSVTFTMPDHDVTVGYDMRNSMERVRDEFDLNVEGEE